MKAQLPERPADTELIAQILSGDMRAMEELMRTHNRKLYRTARAILRDDAEAEDAVQEAYLQAYQALGTFRGESKLTTWQVRIAANEALMRRRRNSRSAAIVQMDGTAHADEAHISGLPGPEDDAERSEVRRLLEARIDALPDDYRATFVLRAVEELTVEETAAVLDIPQATVRTRYFRARGLLRLAMRDDVGQTLKNAFAFAGMRCDRIVREVLPRVRARRHALSMESPPLLITDADLARLTLLAAPTELQREIGRATVISPKVASLVGVVTMNSRVLYTDETTGSKQLVNLVYPQDADGSVDRVSVVAPVGTALIGLSAGQTIDWAFPDGTWRRLRVDEVSHGDNAQSAAFTP